MICAKARNPFEHRRARDPSKKEVIENGGMAGIAFAQIDRNFEGLSGLQHRASLEAERAPVALTNFRLLLKLVLRKLLIRFVRSFVLPSSRPIASRDPDPVEDVPGRPTPQCAPRGAESAPGS